MKEKRCFKIRGKLLYWTGFEWIDKEGNCDHHDKSCDKFDKYNNRCKSNLVGHCCKHVVNGSDLEKEKFSEATGIVKDVSDFNKVLNEYKELSEYVSQNALIVGLSAQSKGKVNIFCVGDDKTFGFVDYISYVSHDSHDSSFGTVDTYGIVSSFYKEIDVDSYWMLKAVGEYNSNGNDYIEREAVKHIFDMNKFDYEPVDCVNAAFQRINYLKKEKVEFDNRLKRISALYMYYHDKTVHSVEKDFYSGFNKDDKNEAKRFVKLNEEKISYGIILLFMEKFFDFDLSFKNAFPSDYDFYNNRVNFDRYIDCKSEDGIEILIRYCERIKNVINSNIIPAWPDMCEDIKSNDDTILAGFTAYDIARRFAYYCMSIMILREILGGKIKECNVDIGFVESIKRKLAKSPSLVKEWWNIYDSLFGLNQEVDKIITDLTVK